MEYIRDHKALAPILYIYIYKIRCSRFSNSFPSPPPFLSDSLDFASIVVPLFFFRYVAKKQLFSRE